ncbi:MAG: NUDIX domain-containing protein [archaeon]|nr:MAG: NUDIX domain-containing protein [archaeon]
MEDEYLDVVDEKDQVIGKELRSTLVASGKGNYRVVNIFILNSNGKVLLPKRDSTKSAFPNCYDFSCGEHVQVGESYEDAAKRGLKEELNLEGIEIKEIGYFNPKDGVSSFMKVFRVVYDQEINANKKEGVESLQFLPVEEIRKMSEENPKLFKDDIPTVIDLLKDKLKW